MQAIAEALADRQPVAIGRLLLGAVYELLHNVSRQLSQGDGVGHHGGPWWFIQLWLKTDAFKAAEFPSLSSQSFPSADFSEADEPIMRQCISMGEALSAMPDVKMCADAFGTWFLSLYNGIHHDEQVWFAFKVLMVLDFEVPFLITPNSMMDNDVSRAIFLSCISPCILPVGIGSDRSQTCSYEFYHPSICARQFGLGQLPIHLFFVDTLRARKSVQDSLTLSRILDLARNITISDAPDFAPRDTFNTGLFRIWWREWKCRIFWRAPSSVMAHPIKGADEV